MASTTASIKVIKSFPFKGGTRDWSNRYHFVGGPPPDAAHWTTLSDAVVAAEHSCFNSATTIIQTLGYLPGSDVPVFEKVYSQLGTLTPAANGEMSPGEVVALVRLSTTARSTKNHPIYLFNYYHGAYSNHTTSDTMDELDSAQRAALLAYANSWVAGFSDGANTCKRSSPRGAVAVAVEVEEYLTHRDFPPTTSL